MTDILDLGGRVALVTGAGQGVGRQVALQLADALGSGGVVVNDYVLARAEAVAEEIKAAGGRAIALQCDVSDHAAVKDMVAKAAADLGVVGILVNNAGNAGALGMPIRVPFWETAPTDWTASLAVNLLGVMHCCRAVLPQLVARATGGRIITIVSDAGRVGEAGFEAYSAAKAGAAGFTRSLARSAARYGITANNVALATIRTPAVDAALAGVDESALLRNYLIRRLGEPRDVAAMVAFLASPAAEWITGQTYPVNGGFSVNQ